VKSDPEAGHAPPSKRWLGACLALFVLALIGAALGLFFFNGRPAAGSSAVFEIQDTASGKMYLRLPLDDGFEFSIEFIHSVNQSPVRETFKADCGMIRPVSVRFYSFGAGMPVGSEAGQIIDRDGDALVISGFDQSFSQLNYIVGTVSDHLLYIDGEKISMTDLCGKNAHITIRIR